MGLEPGKLLSVVPRESLLRKLSVVSSMTFHQLMLALTKYQQLTAMAWGKCKQLAQKKKKKKNQRKHIKIFSHKNKGLYLLLLNSTEIQQFFSLVQPKILAYFSLNFVIEACKNPL